MEEGAEQCGTMTTEKLNEPEASAARREKSDDSPEVCEKTRVESSPCSSNDAQKSETTKSDTPSEKLSTNGEPAPTPRDEKSLTAANSVSSHCDAPSVAPVTVLTAENSVSSHCDAPSDTPAPADPPVSVPSELRLPRFSRGRELFVFRLEHSLLMLDPDNAINERHDNTHRTLVSFLWTSGGMRRGGIVRFFFRDGVLSVTSHFYNSLAVLPATAPTERRLLQYIRYALDCKLAGTEGVDGLCVWFHNDNWRKGKTNTCTALSYLLAKGGSAICMCMTSNGVELRQLSTSPLVWNSDVDPPLPQRCVWIIGGPKGFAPWTPGDVHDVVKELGIPFFKISFGRIVQFTSVLAAHVQMFHDMGYLIPAILDLLTCQSEEAYGELTSSVDNAISQFANSRRVKEDMKEISDVK